MRIKEKISEVLNDNNNENKNPNCNDFITLNLQYSSLHVTGPVDSEGAL